ncbi:MAG TPA: hypothetical protein QGH10_04350 [Armatimonadota bacterium]|nr:hypothetical protein [Armatimonadota bacterium]
MDTVARRVSLALLLAAATVVARAAPGPPVVDEPLGARYSLGMTLWHLGRSPEMIARFHEYLRQDGHSPDKLMLKAALAYPTSLHRILLDFELASPEQLNGWRVDGEHAVSGATDAGPTMSAPLLVPKTGTYRMWVRYMGRPEARAVTGLRIYRAGEESPGPLFQADEIYDEPSTEAGPDWHDLIVDLPAGDYTVRLSHVTRWWHGPGAYDLRKMDCMYLTEELWADPPTAEQLQAIRDSASPDGLQWATTIPLAAADRETWGWWQVRPLSWEDSLNNPRLFALSREFWQQTIDELAGREYSEQKDKLPDYRAPERQVVFNETWNMVANPARAARQVATLLADVQTEPLPYHYVWHDIPGNIPDLSAADRPDEYGGWTFTQGCLFASYGNPKGTVATEVPVRHAGTYAMWVLSNSTNLGYTAPWFGTASVDGQEQFTYHHEGKIPSVWMKMGEVTVDEVGPVRVKFTLDGAGAGGTYRRVYTLFLVDDLDFTPKGTTRPPWTHDMYQERATQAGAEPGEELLVWTTDNPYTPLSQEVWADHTTVGRSWPEQPVSGRETERHLVMAQDTVRAVQVGLRNLTGEPLALDVRGGPLHQGQKTFPNTAHWRVVAFAPSGPDRQNWTPFFLLRRPNVTVPPHNVAGMWLTVDSHGLDPGEYATELKLTGKGLPPHVVTVRARVALVTVAPQQPVLVDGYTRPHEGEDHLRDFVEHGLKIWRGEMLKADIDKWGIRLLAARCRTAEDVARIRALGVDYDDWFAVIMDEPHGETEEKLKPYLDAAKALRDLDPEVRISFNPGEAGTVPTFEILEPYCDFWLPYILHLSQHWGGPEKWAIYKAKPWMWYTTPCLWDKNPDLPNSIAAQIRQVPGQTGLCVGTAFFALNYPWRDQWDTAYEHIRDASTMGAVISRHGPVPTRTWEAIREAIQTADMAMLVREKVGADRFEDVTDPALQELIAEGTADELIGWLQQHP